MADEKFNVVLQNTGNNIVKLEEFEKKFESEYDETSKAVEELEEGP
ncbi:unnamed protein product, partial [Rotaria magnacalcarata]